MGTCLSKKKDSSNPSNVTGSKSVSTPPSHPNNVVTVTELELKLKKEDKTVEEKQHDQLAHEKDEGQVKKEIFIIKHRKSHDDINRERNSKIQPLTSQDNVQPQQNNGSPSSSTSSTNEASEKSMGGSNSNNNKTAPSTPNISMVRTSSCTKEEIDAILIQCGRLSRSPSSRAASSSGGRKYSGSKRSFDFDHCDSNETISADSDQKRVINEEHDDGKSSQHQHQHWQRHRHRQSPKKRGSSPSSHGRRRTPSREREQQQQQRSSSRERRVSRSPGKRSSETNNSNNNSGSVRPGKMVSVPATVTSLVMDKSNNGGGVIESAGVKRVSVKRNGVGVGVGVGDGSMSAASSRSQSPAGANGNGNQPYSLSCKNSGRKGEHSPYRRSPLSEIDLYSLAYPQSNTKNSTNKVQNNAKGRESEAEAIQKLNADVNENSKIKEQQEEINVLCSMIDNVAVKNVIQSSADNLKQQPQSLTKSRSSRRSRDLDLNPESLLNYTQTYTSLLLEDIHNFHQKTTQQQLPPCLTKVCSILESVADLNSTTSSNFSADRRSPPTYQSVRNNNEHDHHGQLPSTKDHPFMGSEVVVSDDVMEPSLHKYVTVKRGGVVDMEDQESSGSNSFIATSNGQNHWRDISSSREPNSVDSTDCWTSRLYCREDLDGGSDMKTLSSKRRECDHQHSNGIGRGRLGCKGVIIAAPST